MTYSRNKINFGAGPAALPQEVLEQASQAILSYEDTGVSILSLPHRGAAFKNILDESEHLVKELAGLDDEYAVAWMQGGGRLQFATLPMNFLSTGKKGGYIDSGSWSAAAIEYAKLYGEVTVLASSKDKNYTQLPEWPNAYDSDLSYIHLTTNNTIYGTQYDTLPDVPAPLVADMSSDIFSRTRDYKKCTLFYAVAQKNIGPAGTTLVAVKKDWLKTIDKMLPGILDYRAYVEKNSAVNTPPVFAIYTSMLTLRWVKDRGIPTIEAENKQKAKLLYEEVNRNSLFHTQVLPDHRSMMNVCFLAKDAEKEKDFIDFCEAQDITGVKGHRSIGGFRVSLYNAITLADVQKLVAVMQEFEHKSTK